ncbi:hypothetical protein Cs7R123_07770 [Catellatospora sp. TT07R-123]|uniref:hypothetical protein n=1 Tax=Catellatospora sp. TT07R-123 TaxID=2733863 RepID=UPI001B2ED7FF|nr:hypothetical protein [Catellatospora sp. TT07R-123]GHJ43435.1 hypothetical protein Cs7R123_07770 [Catellatospora sp. TT07R-123]
MFPYPAKQTAVRTAAVAAFAVLALAGCGTRAACPPPVGSAPQGSKPEAVKPDFGFKLPRGDKSPNELIANSVYKLLSDRHCKTAQKLMSQTEGNITWRDFEDPREVLLFQAAVELCGNDDKAADPQQAAKLWNAVPQLYGNWNLIGWDVATTNNLSWHICETYRAVASAIMERPKDDFECERGERPQQVEAYLSLQGQGPDPRELVQ